MKKIFALIVVLAVLAVSSIASAADGTASATVFWRTPITVTEVNPYSFTLSRKAGVDKMSGVTNLDTGSSEALNYFSTYPTATPGCFKITGDPNTTVRVTITIPSSIGTMTLSGTPAGKPDTSCGTTSHGYNANNLPVSLGSSGETFFIWGISGSYMMNRFVARVTLPNLQDTTFTATATVTVNY